MLPCFLLSRFSANDKLLWRADVCSSLISLTRYPILSFLTRRRMIPLPSSSPSLEKRTVPWCVCHGKLKENPVELMKIVKWNWLNGINFIFMLNKNTCADRDEISLIPFAFILPGNLDYLHRPLKNPLPHNGHFLVASGALLLCVFPFFACTSWQG